MKVCSNAIQSTNDLFKASDKKNTKILNERNEKEREKERNVSMRKKIMLNLEMNYLIFLLKEWENCKSELNSYVMK